MDSMIEFEINNNNNNANGVVPLYSVDIDFDEASRMWKLNKRSKGNGCYDYVCQGITKKNKNCIRKCLMGSQYCNLHAAYAK